MKNSLELPGFWITFNLFFAERRRKGGVQPKKVEVKEEACKNDIKVNRAQSTEAEIKKEVFAVQKKPNGNKYNRLQGS